MGTRPGGRSARVRAAVIEALLAELAERGVAATTVEGVARRAGVNKTTLYRRWGSKEELILDALLELGERRVPIPDTGSLHDDLLTVAREIVASLSTPEADAVVRAAAAEPGQDSKLVIATRQFWAVRFSLLATIVARAIERGELPEGTDPKPLIEGLLGGIYLRVLVTREPLDDEALVGLADWLTRAAPPPSPTPGALGPPAPRRRPSAPSRGRAPRAS
ncbi:MAG: TetR/AcrR family transcriptional regulator [Actinobacteria bacterium]|nr:MAG: TetR/AcrR family transcriptional regulator [Actinomycetota bacterium]